MTRVNLTEPSTLWDKHLLAELREIPRIPNSVLAGKYRSAPPKSFRLGTGHVLFFTNKLGWLKNRYDALMEESRRRGFNVEYRFPDISGIEGDCNWTPTYQDVMLSQQRIDQRTPKDRKYYGQRLCEHGRSSVEGSFPAVVGI